MQTVNTCADGKGSPFGSIIRTLLLIFVASYLSFESVANARTFSIDDQEKQVREFVAAFNTRSLDKMLEMVDDGIQWLSVNGTKISVETEGKTALKESMEKYFQECPSCKSSLEWVQTAGSRVTAKERASWAGKNGPREQSSLSVYEFKSGKIIRIYYFPGESEIDIKK